MKISERWLIACGLFCTSVLLAHHGPGWRGFNPDQTVAITGVITKCFDCKNGAKGHGYLTVQVEGTSWEVTLPDTPRLRQAKVSLSKMKKGTPIHVSGYPTTSPSQKVYATEIVLNGVKLFSPSAP